MQQLKTNYRVYPKNTTGHALPKPQIRKAIKTMYHSSNKQPSFLLNCFYYCIGYSDRTTIHGFKYLSERKRSAIEKICWALAMAMSLYICTSLILNIYQKWVSSPVLVTFASSETSILEIPFPAVTICPEVKSDKTLFNYTDVLVNLVAGHNVSQNEKKIFEAMLLICVPLRSLEQFQKTDAAAIDYIMKVGLHIEKYAFDIKWRGRHISLNGSEIFVPILTAEGLCYTFNMFDRTEIFSDIVKHHGDDSANSRQSMWNPETGYSVEADKDSYPRRSLSAGADGGLIMSLKVLAEQCDYMCGDTIQGYKVALHQPSELPRVTENYFRVPLEYSVVAAIKPNMMTTSSALRNYKAQDRKCYYTNEKFLKFFKIYNQQNCLIECITNFTFEMCGCVSFYLPRDNSTPTCGAAGRICSITAEEQLYSKLKPVNESAEEVNYIDECNCLPACHSLNFDIETSETQVNLKEKLLILHKAGKTKKRSKAFLEDRFVISELHLFFKEMQFIRSERRELYGYTDFWAAVGGLLGLFTGFSLLSMVEIFYYLTLRPFYNVRMFGCRYWSGAPELL